jgi:hypothetical protein
MDKIVSELSAIGFQLKLSMSAIGLPRFLDAPIQRADCQPLECRLLAPCHVILLLFELT